MVEFLVDNIYVRFGGQLFRQMVGIPMGTNCAPLLADLFLYSYENEFLDKLIKEGKRKLARKFNRPFRRNGRHFQVMTSWTLTPQKAHLSKVQDGDGRRCFFHRRQVITFLLCC